MDRFIAALRQFGIGRLAAILGVSAGVAATLAAVVLHLGGTPMSLLYGDIDPKEASSITAALEQAGVKYELSPDGSAIKVPSDKVASTRLLLAGKGVEINGSMGYEIFDKTSALGQTDFVQNINAKRALEGELARTIGTIKGVSSPRVLLVLPKRELFEETAEEPKASITLGFTRAPSADTVRAIQNLVASGVPGLKPEKVTIADQSGKLLSAGEGGDATGLAAEQRSKTEKEMEQKIQAQLDSMLGAGHSKVTVNAELDMAQVTTQKEAFDPDGSVVRSSQTGEQTSKETNASGNNSVTAANNVPGNSPQSGTGDQSGSTTGDTSETTNYMNSSTKTTSVILPGAVKRLSVAVAVDNAPGPLGKDGKRGASKPRSAAEITNIENLVKAAMGYTDNPDRKDQVTVAAMPFQAEDADGTAAKGGLLSGFGKDELMRGIEYLVLLVVALLSVFFVARPLLKGLGGGGGAGSLIMPMMGGGSGGPMPALSGAASGGGAMSPSEVGQLTMAPPADSGIDIARIEGQVKASAVKQVADFVERHPDESVSILRSWLHDA